MDNAGFWPGSGRAQARPATAGRVSNGWVSAQYCIAYDQSDAGKRAAAGASGTFGRIADAVHSRLKAAAEKCAATGSCWGRVIAPGADQFAVSAAIVWPGWAGLAAGFGVGHRARVFQHGDGGQSAGEQTRTAGVSWPGSHRYSDHAGSGRSGAAQSGGRPGAVDLRAGGVCVTPAAPAAQPTAGDQWA